MKTPEVKNMKLLPAAHRTFERLQLLIENGKVLLEYSKYDYTVYIWKQNNTYCYARVYEDDTTRISSFSATLDGLKELVVTAFFEDAYIGDTTP